MCGPLLPWVWHLDPVCLGRLHPRSGPGRAGQQPSHRGGLWLQRLVCTEQHTQPITFHFQLLCIYCSKTCFSRDLWLFAVCLQVNVGHPSEVDEIFDAISYSKGASVIRMLHNYIGDEVGNVARGRHCVVSGCVFCSLPSKSILCRTSGKEWTPIFWSSSIKMHRQVRTCGKRFPHSD